MISPSSDGGSRLAAGWFGGCGGRGAHRWGTTASAGGRDGGGDDAGMAGAAGRAGVAGGDDRVSRTAGAPVPGFTNEFPWQWGPKEVDEWTLTLTSERHLAPSTIRGYQTDLRLFSEYLTDGRYGWAAACQEAFGTFPVPICHEWNTIAHLSEYEGSPEARPLS